MKPAGRQTFRCKVHAPQGELEGQSEYFRIQDVWFIWRVLSETSVDCCLDDDATWLESQSCDALFFFSRLIYRCDVIHSLRVWASYGHFQRRRVVSKSRGCSPFSYSLSILSFAISVYFPCSRIFCLFSTYRLNLTVLCKWAGCELILHFVVWQLANLMSPAIPLLSTNLECVRLA